MENITVHLDAFEGPLDLLYHLIEKNKINIYDIPIVLITDQYLAYLDNAKTKDMESMSGFLLMAATLLEIKSKMLLPKRKTEEEEQGEDPREALVNKLLEYKRFKNITEELKNREEGAAQVLYKRAGEALSLLQEEKEEETLEEMLEGITLQDIYKAFEEVMRRREQKVDRVRSGFDSVERDIYTIEEKIAYIQDLLILNPRIRFYSIFREDSSKMEIVVTFLAVLELMKQKKISIIQEKLFDDIMIKGYQGGGAG